MKRKRLLFLMLAAMFLPLAVNAQSQSLFSEDFEGGSMPSGWTQEGNNTWSVATTVNSTHPNSAGHGTYCAQIKHNTKYDATKLITPEIDLSSVTSAELSFMHVHQDWDGDTDVLKVYYRTSSSGTWTQLMEYTDAYESWTTESGIVLPNLSSTYQIAFEYTDMYGYGLGIDYVNIVPGAACPKPTGVTPTNPTAHGATVSWTGSSDSYILMLGQPTTLGSYDFESNSIPAAFTNDATYPWSVVANNHSGSYCAKSASGFTSTNSDLSLTVNLAAAGFVDFSALVSCESGWDYGRFLIDGTQKFEVSGTSNSWEDYSFPLTAGSHTLTWRYYKDGSGDEGDDCFYVDDIKIYMIPTTWDETHTAIASPYTFTDLDPETLYLVMVKGICDGEPSEPSAAVSFTTLESCATPQNLAVTTDGVTATATWTGAEGTCNIDINGTVTNNVTSPYTFNVELSTTYAVKVQANCDGGETSDWTSPVSVTTPDCIGGHIIEYTLNDSWGDGWTGSTISAILVKDACGIVETLTIPSGSYSSSGTLTLCGDYYEFVWQAGQYPSECSFTFTEGGTTLFTKPSSATDGMVLYTIGTNNMLPKPTALTAGTPGRQEVELSWTENGSATAWEICVNGDEANPVPANTNTNFELNTLTPDTEYTVKVRATNGTNESCWSDEISFTTAEACAKPTSLVASNPTANSIDLTWSGTNDYYEVRYIETMPTADFEDGLGAWTTIDADGDGFTWLWSANDNGIQGHNNSSNCVYSQSYDNDGEQALTPDNYLVSPKVQLGGSISFYAKGQDPNWAAENFGVAVSTTGNTNAADFTMVMENETATGDWVLYTVDLSAYSGEGYVAIRHYGMEGNDQFYLDVDDITITLPETADWNIINNITENTYTLEDLDGNTTYAIQVRGYCEGETEPSNWCEAITETTINGNIFTTAGNWNVAANWAGGVVPAAGSDVIIAANVTVPAQYVADAGNITFENSTTITVADGGQLKTTSSGVNATMQKTILGYGSENTETRLGYYLIANPVIGDQDPDDDLGMITGEYDLYYFDLNCDGTYGDYGVIQTEGTDGNEWRNYEEAAFDLVNGQGYLYANENRVDLAFTGEVNPTNANIKVIMHYSASAEFPGMNLLGNPYTCNAYIADGRNFYVVNSETGDLIESSGAIAPMQGVFVNATAIGNLNFTTTAPANNSKSTLNINLTRQNTLLDRAAVNFGEGEGLVKFQLNPNHTKVYMPVEGKDYAVVTAEEQGEMPVSFKAESNGSYTISFTTENVSFSYLHLIDNLTGADVDLLANPSYSFDARTTDYESRFRLVFATGSSVDGDNFGFVNASGNFCIFGIEGEATVQVIDMLGHVLSSETFSGSYEKKINGAPGVYMIRLINGDNVRVQKVVVR